METPILILKKNNGIMLDKDVFFLLNNVNRIGRDISADLRITDPFISRFQAEIFTEDNKWYICDKMSKNGSFLNNQRIGTNALQLNNEDTICFCNKVEFVFKAYDWDTDITQAVPASDGTYGISMLKKSEEVIIDGIKLSPRLSQQEWKFLSLLVNEPDRIHTYRELAKEMYNVQEDIFVIPSYLKQIRSTKNDICKKLRKIGINRKVIKSRSGVGYQLVEK